MTKQNSHNKTAIVIGAGVAGLSTACYLAKLGFTVTVLEKNDSPGGRARQFSEQGFLFDMGPSWYWMPDVFEKFYQDFGYTTSDFYELIRLNPSYRVVDKAGNGIDIPANMQELENLFEQFEPGSAVKLRQFLQEAAYKYKVGMEELVYKPGMSVLEFADVRLLKGIIKMDVFTSIKKHIRQFVSHPFLIELLEFPILFLGALPKNTPALYSLMNYADMQLGTWYPKGGMYKVVDAFVKIANNLGVQILVNQEVKQLVCNQNAITSVVTNNQTFKANVIVGAGDYHHIDQHLLPAIKSNYTSKYWADRKMAPTCLLYYVGLNKKIPKLQHHNLFFDADFAAHAEQIYTTPSWPNDPLFYVSVTSKTDEGVAPNGCENLFILIPLAPGLEDTPELHETYFELVMDRLEKFTGTPIKQHVVFKKPYGFKNFVTDYHAFKGNAYGLANTLTQTAVLKPKIKNKKLNNLYYAGQLTVPGPGLPPSIISGNVVANFIQTDFKSN